MAINTIYAYQNLRRVLREKIDSLTGPLFTTDAEDLFGLYLRGLDCDRQVYNCKACAAFIRQYGGLATIDEQGRIESALWRADYPAFFRLSTETMRERVVESRVTGVYVNGDPTWGKFKSGGWLHLSGRLSVPRVVRADRVHGALSREYKLLHHSLSLCDRDAVAQSIGRSIRVIRSINGSGIADGAVEWLAGMQRAIRERNGNLLWRLVATAPPGHSQMILLLIEAVRTALPCNHSTCPRSST
jgi:hypothetical protein